MALVVNEEQVMLRDAARDFLAGSAPVSHLRQLRDNGSADGFSRELWGAMAELGWPAILVPEEYGGLAYGYAGLGLVLEETGRTLTPSPLLGTALTAVAAFNFAGSEAQCSATLPGVASGKRIVSLACDEPGRHAPGHNPEQEATTAAATADGFRLNGRKTAVIDGQAADTFLVSAATGDGLSLFLVPASAGGLTVERSAVLDTHAAAEVIFHDVALPPDALLGERDRGGDLLEQILDVARIGASAELLGLAQEAFERTVNYLKERKQFGVPIGSFQALQHRAAKLHAEIELCKSVVLKALQALDEGAAAQSVAELASLAKAKVSTTAHLAATEAIQMHGGIGMSDDFDIGFFLKRCRILETLYGDRYFHLDRYAGLRGY
ncbi:MAG: acyl-CoA dehydrogenase family protein [Lysobacterales bacterium]